MKSEETRRNMEGNKNACTHPHNTNTHTSSNLNDELLIGVANANFGLFGQYFFHCPKVTHLQGACHVCACLTISWSAARLFCLITCGKRGKGCSHEFLMNQRSPLVL